MALTQLKYKLYEFTKGDSVKHTLIVLYHSQSNSQAERFVQAFKRFFNAGGEQLN